LRPENRITRLGTWRRRARTGSDNRALDELTREVGELGKQVSRLQADLDRLRAGTRTGASGTAAPGASPYNQAIHLARQGASAGEVASGCGISRGEAELIVALYRKLRI